MLEPLQLPFMQRAVLEVLLLAPVTGLLGAQIVLRRLAFFTHGVGAATFPGLVVAGPAGLPPALLALVAGGGFAGLLERFGRGRASGPDAATAIVLAGALAVGVVLASDVFESGAGVDQLLFGSLLGIGTGELLVTGAALAAVAVTSRRFRRAWIAGGFDAAGAGPAVGTALAERALLAAIAVAVIASLDAAGALLVGAILVIPAATARLFAPSVVALELGAGALALAEGLAGLAVAYRLDVPPGAAIAVLGGGIFAGCLVARALAARFASRPAEVPA